jgi:hypothetical protein
VASRQLASVPQSRGSFFDRKGSFEERDVTGRLVTAAELAKALGVTRGWVYEHKDELGFRLIRKDAGPTRRCTRQPPAPAQDVLTLH